MTNTIIFTVVTLSVLGLILAVILYVVAKRFKVQEDPRIDEVEAILPGANCGGCGYAGCRAFAENCVKFSNLDGKYCNVGGNEVMKKIAAHLGLEVKEKEPMIAVVRCQGSCDHRPKTNEYDGVSSCKAMSSLYAGDTDCKYGCLGLGDCERACSFGGLKINPTTHLPEVDESLCVACGSCVKACPKGVIELRNKGIKGRRVYVSCINKDKGAVARKACTTACIGCMKCQKVCKFEAITVENNLSYIDFTKCRLCHKCVDECPTKAIVAVNFPVKAINNSVPAPEVKPEVVSTQNS